MSVLSSAMEVQREEGTLAMSKRSVQYLWRQTRRVRYPLTGQDVVEMDTPAGPIEFKAGPMWRMLDTVKAGGVYEPLLLHLLEEALEPSDTFYNVGARWGIFSLFAEKHGLAADRIHNFEADEDNFELLTRNVDGAMYNNRTFVGASDSPDHLTLDAYARDHDVPSVIKIDVEGAEEAVVRGAGDVIAARKPELFVEVHPEYIRELTTSQHDLIDDLLVHGYELTVYPENRGEGDFTGVPVTEASLPTAGDYLLHAQ